MPQPTASDVHVDAILTSISVAYMQAATDFIASQVFPVIPVDKQSDKYFTFTKGDWFRDEAAVRAPNSESVGSGFNISTDNYSALTYAIHKDIDDQTLANADIPLNPRREAAQFVTQRMLLRREIQFATDFFTTSVWGTDVTPSNLWSDYAASDPIDNIETGKQTILTNTGFMPNTLVLGYQVFRQLKHHPDIIDRFKYTSSNNVTADILARLFEVDRVLVTRAIKNTAVEGASNSFSFVHGKHALLCYVPASPSLMTPAAGYTFAWRGVSDGMGATIGTSSFPMRQLRSERIESQMAWDNKVVSSDLGYFFNGAVA
jgi:hypothetical protein